MSGRFGVGKKSVEWYTPKWIFDELGTKFDLDPSYPEDTKANVKVGRAALGLEGESPGVTEFCFSMRR